MEQYFYMRQIQCGLSHTNKAGFKGDEYDG